MKKEISEYQLKKQEKRLKQRKENIARAQKMHESRVKGKIPKAEEFLFELNPAQNSLKINSTKNLYNQNLLPTDSDQNSKIHIGCSGWFYWDWKGLFYPKELPTNQWFDFYAANFKTVELNAPFYSWPLVTTVKSWIRNAKNQPFIYTVKVCELITHIKRFQGTKILIQDFGAIADLLGPLMGCFLFQLPPSFHYTKTRLNNILNQLDHSRKNVVEFRHESWWNDEVFSAFEKTKTIFCSCSGPKLPEKLIKTADDIYIRFHGTKKWYRHDYTQDELSKWAGYIKKSKAKKIWIYFNNDNDGYAIKNARELAAMLVEKNINK